jgi:hypothetical protein
MTLASSNMNKRQSMTWMLIALVLAMNLFAPSAHADEGFLSKITADNNLRVAFAENVKNTEVRFKTNETLSKDLLASTLSM